MGWFAYKDGGDGTYPSRSALEREAQRLRAALASRRRMALGAFLILLCFVSAVGGAVYHWDRYIKLRLQVIDLQEQVANQKAVIALADDHGGGMEISLATIPPTGTVSYQLILRPLVNGRARR